MTFTIVGCGDSSQNWTENGYAIGVNDCAKFGKPVNALLVCNRPEQFNPERRNTIINSKPEIFYSNKANWTEYYPSWKKVRLHTWNGTLRDWHRSDGPSAYSTNTSPFIAISLAYNLGAKEIIMWGVDFRTHHQYHDNSPTTFLEVNKYLELFTALKERGVNVYRGADGSVFDGYLSLKPKEIEVPMETVFKKL